MESTAPLLEVSDNAGLSVVECLFTRASDSVTMSLFVRVLNGSWLLLQNPSPELAVVIQRGLSDPYTQVKAYQIGQDVGVIVRCLRSS